MKKILAILLLLAVGPVASMEEQFYINNKSDKVYYEYVEMLLNGSLEERVYAADNLRFIRSKRAVRPLMVVLKGKPDLPNAPENSPYLKFTVTQALAALEQPIAIPVIIEQFNVIEKSIDEKAVVSFSRPNDYKMVMAAGEMLRSLGMLGNNPESVTTITNALSHKHYYIRSSAADALSILQLKTSLEKLKGALSAEKDDYAKTSILTAIVNIEKSVDENFRQLVSMLKSENPNVRYRASQGLGEIDLKVSELDLRKALLIEEEPKVREQMKKDLAIITKFETPTPTSSRLEY